MFCMHSGSLLNGRQDEFARDMYSLSQRPLFDVVAFEDLVDKIRSCVAEVTKCFQFLYFANVRYIGFASSVV